MLAKIDSKIKETFEKSTLEAALDHFGDLLGAKSAQERQQELEHMKHGRFLGRQ